MLRLPITCMNSLIRVVCHQPSSTPFHIDQSLNVQFVFQTLPFTLDKTKGPLMGFQSGFPTTPEPTSKDPGRLSYCAMGMLAFFDFRRLISTLHKGNNVIEGEIWFYNREFQVGLWELIPSSYQGYTSCSFPSSLSLMTRGF